MSEKLTVWVVTDHPMDITAVRYVARRWKFDAKEMLATNEVIMSEDLELVREMLAAEGLMRFLPDPADDPVILETWL